MPAPANTGAGFVKERSEIYVHSTREKTEYKLLNNYPVTFVIGEAEYQLKEKGATVVYE